MGGGTSTGKIHGEGWGVGRGELGGSRKAPFCSPLFSSLGGGPGPCPVGETLQGRSLTMGRRNARARGQCPSSRPLPPP